MVFFGNTIDGNVGDGVLVTNNAHSVAISENSIFFNAGLGIDLEDNGNGLTPAPVINSAVASNGQIVVTVTEPGAYSPLFLEFYTSAPGTHSDGQTLLGETTIAGLGYATFTVPMSSTITSGVITVTATDSKFNTSEFSLPVNITKPVVKSPKLPPGGVGVLHKAGK